MIDETMLSGNIMYYILLSNFILFSWNIRVNLGAGG